MNQIPPTLPASAILRFNSLYDQLSPRVLGQDIMLVTLPDGIEIDVGWYPVRDLNGSFCIRVYQHERDNLLEETILLKDPHRVADTVGWLARKYSYP